MISSLKKYHRSVLNSLLSLVCALSIAASEPAIAEQDLPVIMVFGDSLSAAYGMSPELGWVSLLQSDLSSDGLHYQMVNASISGETTAGGLRRFPSLLERWQPDIVILELGGNDGLRGSAIGLIRKNLESMIQQAQQTGATVLLLGMRIPPNYGPRYSNAFHNQYQQLAEQYATLLMPFFLKDIATNKHLMQADGIHPNENAQQIMADGVYQILKNAL